MNPFSLKNLSLNLQATGPAAVLICWCVSVAAVGIFGSGPTASTALGLLAAGGGMILIRLAGRA
jgi:hypothetical protein